MKISITWKQQHINNACLPACSAMLLSQYGIQKEDSEIIYESKRPYLVEYTESDHAFCAGVLVQNRDVMNVAPHKNGLEFVHEDFTDSTRFMQFALTCIENKRAFITGIPRNMLPCPGYIGRENSGRHTIVVHGIENGYFCILDPDGSVDRSKKNKFEDVRSLVSYTLPMDRIEEMFAGFPDRKYHIGYLKEAKNTKNEIPNLLSKSKTIIGKIPRLFREQAQPFMNSSEDIKYEAFFDFLVRMIKPFALDLKNALQTIPQPTHLETDSTKQLNDIFNSTLSFQRELKSNHELKVDNFINDLLVKIDRFSAVILRVIDEEIDRYAQRKPR